MAPINPLKNRTFDLFSGGIDYLRLQIVEIFLRPLRQGQAVDRLREIKNKFEKGLIQAYEDSKNPDARYGLNLDELKPYQIGVTRRKTIYRDPKNPKFYYIVYKPGNAKLASEQVSEAVNLSAVTGVLGVPKILDWGIQDIQLDMWLHLEGIENSKSLRDSEVWKSGGYRWRLERLADLADILVNVHRKGMGFYDLKPDNIVINDKGEILIIDWGSAGPFGANTFLGTKGYEAPDTVTNDRTDVYSLGVILEKEIINKFFQNSDADKNLSDLFIAMSKRNYFERASMGYVEAELRKIAKKNTFIMNTDGAQVSSSKDNSKTGGIDLTSDKVLHVEANSNNRIRFNLDPAMLAEFQNTQGFTPEIINIQSMNNLKEFLLN